MVGPANVTKAPTLAGMQGKVYYALRSWFSALPALPSAPTTFEDLVTLAAGDFTFLAGKAWFTIDCQINKNSLESTLVGEQGSRSFETKGTLTFSGNGAQILGFAEYIKNEDVVILMKHKCGNFRVLGLNCDPAIFDKIEIKSGAAVSDASSVTFEVMDWGTLPPIYSGTIQTTPVS